MMTFFKVINAAFLFKDKVIVFNLFDVDERCHLLFSLLVGMDIGGPM